MASITAPSLPDIESALRLEPPVVYGAGNLGRKTIGLLRERGIEPVAVCDRSQTKWGSTVDGVPVMSPADAASRFGAASSFVVAVWRPAVTGGMHDITNDLGRLGCRRVIPFAAVEWALADRDFVPHYFWDLPSKMRAERPRIDAASTLFSDAESRELFHAQVRLRETADARVLTPVSKAPQYFPEFLRPDASDHFVDCGAYDGDTLRALIAWSGGAFSRFTAYEADPINFERLLRVADATPYAARIHCRMQAVSAATGILRFATDGSAGASLSDEGGIEVEAVSLDDAVASGDIAFPSFIKMDIEGAETDALHGARRVIAEHQPILAICVYHRQSDLWRLPLLMRDLLPDAQLFLRSYCLDGLDTVCYAVPRARFDRLR